MRVKQAELKLLRLMQNRICATMSKLYLCRRLLQLHPYIRSALKMREQNIRRTVTVAAAERHEDPCLANAKSFNDIPSYAMLPFIGTSWTFFPIIGKFKVERSHLADMEKHKKYGDTVRDKFGRLHIVSTYTPESMEVFLRHEGKYPSRGTFPTLREYRKSRKEWYKNTGVLILEGKEWHDLRSKSQKYLMKPRAIQAYLDPMQDVAQDFISLVRHKRHGSNEVPGLLEQIYKWALESVTFIGLDTRLDCLNTNLPADSDGQKMINAVQTQFECMRKMEAFTGNFPFWRYFPTPTWNKFARAGDDFTQIAFKYINQSLDILKKRDEDSDLTLLQSMLLEKGMDVSGAMVTVADMMTAGIDTTSHAVGFLLYHLARNPDKQQLLFQEINQLLPGKEDRITLEIFNKLHYLKACIKESIRMHPVVKGVVRTFKHDVVINGYRVPVGTVVSCVLQVIYKNEKYFKNAGKFVPERWLQDDQKIANPFAFVPFGVGTRSCIGRRLAELEIISLATKIMQNFSMEYHHEDIGMYSGVINGPDRPLRINFLDR